MEHTKRMLSSGYIVAQDQVKLELSVFHAGNRRDCVVLFTVNFRKNKRSLICVCPPLFKKLVGKKADFFRISSVQTDYAHRPLYNSAVNVIKPCDREFFFNRSFRHRELVVSTLKMVMGKNRAANNRQVGVASDYVVRKKLYKVKKIAESFRADFHRLMLVAKDNAVLVVIDIRRILKPEHSSVQLNRNDSVGLARGMVYASCIAFVFLAQKTGWITALLCVACGCDCLWVFFRL